MPFCRMSNAERSFLSVRRPRILRLNSSPPCYPVPSWSFSKPLSQEALGRILDRTLSDEERGLGKLNVRVTAGARERLIGFGNGDARALLTALEFVANQVSAGNDGTRLVDEAALDAALLKKSLRYDKSGEEHYDLISAFIKSMRDSDPDGALYWLARMLEGGENPRFIARRMVIFASEDIGNADPLALLVANAVAQAVEFVGLPEAQINLAQGTTYLASRPKDNASYIGLLEALQDAQEFGNLGVPLHLRNAVTSLMKRSWVWQGLPVRARRSRGQDRVKHTCRNLSRGSGIFGPKTP